MATITESAVQSYKAQVRSWMHAAKNFLRARKQNDQKLFSPFCAHFPTVDFMARWAFGNAVDPGAQRENVSKVYRTQKKAIQIDLEAWKKRWAIM